MRPRTGCDPGWDTAPPVLGRIPSQATSRPKPHPVLGRIPSWAAPRPAPPPGLGRIPFCAGIFASCCWALVPSARCRALVKPTRHVKAAQLGWEPAMSPCILISDAKAHAGETHAAEVMLKKPMQDVKKINQSHLFF